MLAAALVIGLPALGCIVSLDNEFDSAGDVTGGADAGDAGDATVEVLPGCEPFAQVMGAMAVAGDSRSLPLSDGGALWVVDQAVSGAASLDGGVVLSPSFTIGPGAGADCTSWSARLVGPSFAPSPLAPTGLVVALDLVQASAGPALYYELFASDANAPLGLRSLGFGLAPQDPGQDPGSGRFVPTGELLWSADRPAYGGSALRLGNLVYAYGCASGGFLVDDCFLARADASALASTAGYAYWAGGQWSSNPDDAVPVVQGVGPVSVRVEATDAEASPRFVMTYVPPLGSTIVARTAIAPEGPWSGPTTLATCELDGAGPGSFCSGAQQHPELATAAGPVVVTYDAKTFATDAAPDPSAFAPRLVAFPPL